MINDEAVARFIGRRSTSRRYLQDEVLDNATFHLKRQTRTRALKKIKIKVTSRITDDIEIEEVRYPLDLGNIRKYRTTTATR